MEALEKEAAGNINKLLAAFEYHVTKRLPKQFKLRNKNFAGSSFMLDPAPLFAIKSVDPIYIAQYIKLASYRDYTNYKLYNHTHLDLSFYPDLKVEVVKHNPLIIVNSNSIRLKFEEKYNGSKIR